MAARADHAGRDHGGEDHFRHAHGPGGHSHAPAGFGRAFAIGVALNAAIMRRAALRAAGAARAAAAAVTMLAVLLLAVSHVEADHGPATGRQSALVAAAPCHTAPVSAVGAAAECSAPCVATLGCGNGTAGAFGLRSEIVRVARKSFSGAAVALATPPPRIG